VWEAQSIMWVAPLEELFNSFLEFQTRNLDFFIRGAHEFGSPLHP